MILNMKQLKTGKSFIFLSLLILGSCAALPAGAEGAGTVRIMSFNIQIFGAAKMSKPEAADILSDIVSKADIAAIQELRSASPAPVEQFMALLPGRYGYVMGSREGRSASKEQFLIIYDTEKFSVINMETWPDEDDIFERNPLAVYFKSSGAFDFILISSHIQPGNAEAEISALPEVAAYYRDLWNEPDVFVLGDFNADGRYYDESLLEGVFPETDYLIIIPNDYDTTLGSGDNAYDRFIITSPAIEDYAGNFGVIRFDELYDFSVLSIEPREISDHYPVWADFWLHRDTD